MFFLYRFVQKYLFWLILAAIVLGLLMLKINGGYNFTPALCALAALIMIYPSLVPLDFDRIREIGRFKKLIIISIFINFLIIPLLALLIGWIFLRSEPMLWLGMILLSILPGGGMVTTWAYKSKANMPLTVGIVFANLIAAVILVPFYLTIALNKLIIPPTEAIAQSCILEPATKGAVSCLFNGIGNVSPLKIAVPILIIIIVPLILAYFTQTYFKRRLDGNALMAIKKKFAAFSNLGLIFILFALMGIKENKIIFERPDLLIKAIVPLVIFYFISITISLTLYRSKKGPDGLAIAWGTYLRYITLALGLAVSLIYQNPGYSLTIIVIILAYLIQIPSSFWLAKKFNK